jgi:cytochrome c oxidase subunit 1/cytochrome c oxidase subunit I+III
MIIEAVDAPPSGHNPKLQKIWETRPGLSGWLSTVDHKSIGIRYIVTAFFFMVIGGLEALVMRVQLAQGAQNFLTPEQYNQVFSMHGITMVFLYAMPVLSGFSNYLWPLLLGARDMAFPRLNAFSYWLYLFAGLFIYSTMPFGQAPDAGWFNYVPLAAKTYDFGLNIDVFTLGVIFIGLSTTGGAINFVVTLMRVRAPGMSINRMPILIWGTLTASLGNIFAVPAVSLACALLWFDRNLGTRFFSVDGGGQPLLWQHLFWIFGHPWVYAIVLPSMGMVSDALPTLCRRPLVGYTAVALATVSTMVVGFGVWVHHMFATGLPPIGLSFFGAASMVIVIPSAVSVFAWIATIWTGRPTLNTAFLHFASFVLLFVIGGVSGFMTAAVPLDWQLTDTYFVVAHIHYVLLGINVFPVLGGVYFWFPKMTGRMMNEKLGKVGFWFTFAGFNIAFFPMHIVGLLGMPRRVYSYATDLGLNDLNLAITLGAFVLAIGLLLFFWNVVSSARDGAEAGKNPWSGPTLEWAVASPPPPYNFAVIPTIASRHPLWEPYLADADAPRSMIDRGFLLDDGRQTLATSILDAEPQAVLSMPDDTLVPFLISLAVAALFAALLLHGWICAALAMIAIIMLAIRWLNPPQIRAAHGS